MLHIKGHGWIDITSKQKNLLEHAECSMFAFRLEGNKVYYLNYSELKKYLTLDSMLNNDKEGDHWKLYIWPNYIEIRGNKQRLLIEPDKLDQFTIV